MISTTVGSSGFSQMVLKFSAVKACREPRRAQCVEHQHRDGHGANATGDGRNGTGHLGIPTDRAAVEHERLLDQNKSLMEQNSQYQASNKDAKMRASELSSALKEAFERRDELQRQLKDIRGNLETAVSERDQLLDNSAQQDLEQQLAERDARIEKLSAELKNWQDRLPPLIERYQQRNAEAEQLEEQLAALLKDKSALEGSISEMQEALAELELAGVDVGARREGQLRTGAP